MLFYCQILLNFQSAQALIQVRSLSYYDKLVDTINHNDIETDEFAVGSFTLSNAKTMLTF